MFSFNPELAAQNDIEDGDEAFDYYDREEEEEDMQYKELDLEALALEAQEADDSGTIAKEDRLTEDSNTPEGETSNSNGAAVPINENLFLEEDLDGLDEELNDLDIEE